MRLLLIRHADPDYANDTITPAGHKQASLLAEALAPMKIDELVASSCGRAMETARCVAERKRLPVLACDWLREVNGNYNPGNPGTLSYHGVDLFAAGLSVTTENWRERVPYGAHTGRHAPPLLTGFAAFMAERGFTADGLRWRCAAPGDPRTLAIFAHAGTNLTLLAELLHIPIPVAYAQFSCDPASISRLLLEEKEGFGVFRLETWNDTSHLDGIQTHVMQDFNLHPK